MAVIELIDDLSRVARIEVAIQQRHLVAGAGAHDHHGHQRQQAQGNRAHRGQTRRTECFQAVEQGLHGTPVIVEPVIVEIADMRGALFTLLELFWLAPRVPPKG